jgi:hypothetical protein
MLSINIHIRKKKGRNLELWWCISSVLNYETLIRNLYAFQSGRHMSYVYTFLLFGMVWIMELDLLERHCFVSI